ncbi:GID complex subunit 4, VID24 [Coemansia sp. RSA 1933]|nr:GID complex subunit 4, VID24 [Coemansia sp. RSA 1933]
MRLAGFGAGNCSQENLLVEARQQQSPPRTACDYSLVYTSELAVDGVATSSANSGCPEYLTEISETTATATTLYPTSASRKDSAFKDLCTGADGPLDQTQWQISSSGHNGEYMVDSDYEIEEGADEEDMRNEPLPTPEQLILSQSWSTWPTPCHHLYSGSRFSGTQSNGTRSYMVTVTLKYVDMGVPELCGHFTIRGLTNELPKLTTYFDAQIIGAAGNSFVTSQWDATVDTDRTHWGFFPAFRQHRSTFDSGDSAYRLRLSDRYVFMRWKERFVVPNYKLSRINGASYDGFYYVCYDRVEESITGYYFHRDSDNYQCLKLSHEPQTSFSHFELA